MTGMSVRMAMASARGVGGAAFKMQLRSRKREFASSAATTSSSSISTTTPRKKKAAKAKLTSQGSNSRGVKPKVVAPNSSKFPVLTALKDRVNQTPDDSRIMLAYPNLTPARLLRRYKRFLADVVLLDGTAKDESQMAIEVGEGEEAEAEEVITVYCPNTGPMVGLLDGLPNARVQLSKSNDPKRKYAYTLEMIQIHNGERDVWVGVHSTSANRMVEQALMAKWFTELGDYDSVRREVKFAKNSRVDFVLTKKAEDGSVAHEKYVEVKSVTLALEGAGEKQSRCAVFPDTVSTRAQKHVTELTELLSAEVEAKEATKEKETAASKVSGAIVFLVQRDDCHEFAPSIQHDKKFADLCAVAAQRGIQLLAYTCALEPDEANSSGVSRLLGLLPLQKAQD